MATSLDGRRNSKGMDDQERPISMTPRCRRPFGRLISVQNRDSADTSLIKQYEKVSGCDGSLKEIMAGVSSIPLQEPLPFQGPSTFGDQGAGGIEIFWGGRHDMHLSFERRGRRLYPDQAGHPSALRAVAAVRVQARIGEGVEAAAEDARHSRGAQALPRELVKIA